ncbi:MAG: hypothetical protein C0601_06820 [Candidatus Muiribacterium halophilum]|uniref:Uncharacterized protein n=1 Tax=Muiribacterium halophilum TaxID=2053465 RepID=A0A2N5ZG98_MUIH1|nr:MAG: hypothetical protein C0601_06820 [Candidatus Muirbacterium halophilum]
MRISAAKYQLFFFLGILFLNSMELLAYRDIFFDLKFFLSATTWYMINYFLVYFLSGRRLGYYKYTKYSFYFLIFPLFVRIGLFFTENKRLTFMVNEKLSSFFVHLFSFTLTSDLNTLLKLETIFIIIIGFIFLRFKLKRPLSDSILIPLSVYFSAYLTGWFPLFFDLLRPYNPIFILTASFPLCFFFFLSKRKKKYFLIMSLLTVLLLLILDLSELYSFNLIFTLPIFLNLINMMFISEFLLLTFNKNKLFKRFNVVFLLMITNLSIDLIMLRKRFLLFLFFYLLMRSFLNKRTKGNYIDNA